ncbi:MAG: HD domain-containing protein [Patescibacteria group bacterium]|nr:HD domain-containing protein [Patescibacteria group bacterium]
MNIVNQIRKFVEEECKKPTSKYGPEPFHNHLIPMVEYSKRLADELGGDKEIVLIAAWLHDLGSWIIGRKDHHITGAKIAEEKLRELNYPKEKIELIKKCIMNHRGSVPRKCKSIEEKIIAEADAISNFDDIVGIFQTALVYEKLDRNEAKKAVREKLKRKWNQLRFNKSKEMVRLKYEAAMLLLK